MIEGCRKRQPKAQQTLYQQYSARMFGVCLRYAGSREDAEDILHEALLRYSKRSISLKEKVLSKDGFGELW